MKFIKTLLIIGDTLGVEHYVVPYFQSAPEKPATITRSYTPPSKATCYYNARGQAIYERDGSHCRPGAY